MYIKEYPEILNHPNTRVTYIRKKIRRKVINDQPIYYSQGEKRGVMISFINPNDPNMICMGWSICNSIDKWDHVNGVKVKNFGKNLAISRAFKLIEPNRETHIPDTIFNLFYSFFENSQKYYLNPEKEGNANKKMSFALLY